MKLRLLSYNIRFGGHGREALIAEVIRTVAPDIVIFQEATDPRVIEAIAETTGMPHWAATRSHSVAYISRVAVADHAWHRPPAARHPFLEVTLADAEARLFGLHLSARFSKWSERRRTREVRALLDGVEQHKSGFHILTGDFNTLAPGELLDVRRMPAWIQALIWVSGRDIQRETIKTVINAGYADGYRTIHPDVKGYTFPTWDAHLRLDYIFLPVAFADRLVACQVIDDLDIARRASDHYPLLATLDLKPRATS